MKYYYNGKLVRTSKHVYNYVLITEENAPYAFSKDKKNLESEKNRELNYLIKQLNYCKTHKSSEKFTSDYEKHIENVKAWHIEEIKGVED